MVYVRLKFASNLWVLILVTAYDPFTQLEKLLPTNKF